MLCETKSSIPQMNCKQNSKHKSYLQFPGVCIFAIWKQFKNNWKQLKESVFSLNSTLKLSMNKLIWKHSQSYKSGFPFTLEVILKLLPKFYSSDSNEREAKKNTSRLSTACSLYGYRYSTQSDPNTLHSAVPWRTEVIHSPALCPCLGTQFMFQTSSWWTFQHT